MRIKITQSFADGWSGYHPGQELDVSDKRGLELLRIGVAVRLTEKPETATAKRGEQAVRIAPVR